VTLPSVFLTSPLNQLGLSSRIEDVIDRVNWLICDFNERHSEDAQPENKVAEQTPTNSAMVPCPAHDPGFTCLIRLAGRCETKPCLVMAQHQ
jgi:hypothetical protein